MRQSGSARAIESWCEWRGPAFHNRLLCESRFKLHEKKVEIERFVLLLRSISAGYDRAVFKHHRRIVTVDENFPASILGQPDILPGESAHLTAKASSTKAGAARKLSASKISDSVTISLVQAVAKDLTRLFSLENNPGLRLVAYGRNLVIRTR